MTAYSDSDFAGCRLSRKRTSETYHFLGKNLISWSSRKQNSVAISSTEVEYIAVGSYCTQSLWIKYQLEDYKINLDKILDAITRAQFVYLKILSCILEPST